jgi:hypothetical protein
VVLSSGFWELTRLERAAHVLHHRSHATTLDPRLGSDWRDVATRLREPVAMAGDLGPWTRLIEDHRRNLVRLDAIQPPPPPFWGLPLGVAVPWLLFLVAAAWSDPLVLSTAMISFALLVPIGLACLFVERLQIVTVGLLLGMASAFVVAWGLFG